MGRKKSKINLPDMPELMPELNLPTSQELENQNQLMQQEQAGRMSVESTIKPTAMQQTEPKNTLMAKKSKKKKGTMVDSSMSIY